MPSYEQITALLRNRKKSTLYNSDPNHRHHTNACDYERRRPSLASDAPPPSSANERLILTILPHPTSLAMLGRTPMFAHTPIVIVQVGWPSRHARRGGIMRVEIVVQKRKIVCFHRP